MGRLDEVRNRPVVFGPHRFVRIGRSPIALLIIQIAGEVRGDHVPGHPLVPGPQYVLGCVVIGVRLVHGTDNRRVPVKQVLHFPGRQPQVEVRFDHHQGPRLRWDVQQLHIAEVTSPHDLFRVVRVEAQKGAFPPGRGAPVLPADPGRTHPDTGNLDRGIVLLPPVEVVREEAVHGYPVELGSGHVILARPAAAPVKGDLRPPVVGNYHVFRIFRVDPQIVVVAVVRADLLPVPPPVDGSVGRGA